MKPEGKTINGMNGALKSTAWSDKMGNATIAERRGTLPEIAQRRVKGREETGSVTSQPKVLEVERQAVSKGLRVES